jgi:hypothetical protein
MPIETVLHQRNSTKNFVNVNAKTKMIWIVVNHPENGITILASVNAKMLKMLTVVKLLKYGWMNNVSVDVPPT